MNEHVRNITPYGEATVRGAVTQPATQFADGWPRRKWSVDEMHKMIECGILRHGERFELVGGELIAMAPKGPLHEDLKTALMRHWTRIAPDSIRIAT